MSYPKYIKQKAIECRKKGFSIIQIARKFGFAKSTISLWVRDIPLPQYIQKKLYGRELSGREKGLAVLAAKRELAKKQREKETEHFLDILRPLEKKNILKLLCGVIFWCEGSKRRLSNLTMANSDPNLIRIFLHCLRNGFEIREERLRAQLHIHEYHNEKNQLNFWSKITNIPISRFNKVYKKPHTGIRTRQNYEGCLSIRYGEARIARILDALYHGLAKSLGA